MPWKDLSSAYQSLKDAVSQPATAKPYALRTYANGHEERLGREGGREKATTFTYERERGSPRKSCQVVAQSPLFFSRLKRPSRRPPPPSRIKARNLNEIISPPESGTRRSGGGGKQGQSLAYPLFWTSRERDSTSTLLHV